MAYIGTSPSNGVRRVHTYTATAGQTTFTGSSTEGVTLTYADTNYIDVFQNGVLLGSADYTSTSGTSVVLAQGASVSDLVVIVVYDVFSVADTVSKTNGGSFDSGVTFSSDVTIGDASAADKKILFDGNAVDYHIGLDDSADSLIIGKGSALGTTTSMAFDANGIITKPLQPAFLADCNYVESNLAINASHTVPALNERFDQNSDYNNSTYTFTAPITGKYQLNANFYVHFFDDSTNYVEFLINTSNRVYRGIIDNSLTPGDVDNYNNCVSVLADMDASDTAHMQINIPNSGTAQMRHSNLMTFSGYLVA